VLFRAWVLCMPGTPRTEHQTFDFDSLEEVEEQAFDSIPRASEEDNEVGHPGSTSTRSQRSGGGALSLALADGRVRRRPFLRVSPIAWHFEMDGVDGAIGNDLLVEGITSQSAMPSSSSTMPVRVSDQRIYQEGSTVGACLTPKRADASSCGHARKGWPPGRRRRAVPAASGSSTASRLAEGADAASRDKAPPFPCSPHAEGHPEQIPATADRVEVLVRHALNGIEMKVMVPRNATFKTVKKAIARKVGRDEVLERGKLVKKDMSGVYVAYKDGDRLADVRRVLVVSADLSSGCSGTTGGQVEDDDIEVTTEDEEDPSVVAACERRAAEKVAERERRREERAIANAVRANGALTKEQAIRLQMELYNGFSADDFQRRLIELESILGEKGMSSAKYIQARQTLFLTVHGAVLPRFGFEGTMQGVYRMMSAMKPFGNESEVMKWTAKVNGLIGVETSPETWDRVMDSLQNLDQGAGLLPTRSQKKAGGSVLGRGGEEDHMKGTRAQAARDVDAAELAKIGVYQGPAKLPAIPGFLGTETAWPGSNSPPIMLYVVGSWSNYQREVMIFDFNRFYHTFAVGHTGVEHFRILLDGAWDKTIYPSVAGANPSVNYSLQGPDSGSEGKSWTIGGQSFDMPAAGTQYKIIAMLNGQGGVRRVYWHRCGT